MEAPKQVSTEYNGLGQSGYTAGRRQGDPSLGLEDRYRGYPKGEDAQLLEREDDDRFIGCGGSHVS